MLHAHIMPVLYMLDESATFVSILAVLRRIDCNQQHMQLKAEFLHFSIHGLVSMAIQASFQSVVYAFKSKQASGHKQSTLVSQSMHASHTLDATQSMHSSHSWQALLLTCLIVLQCICSCPVAYANGAPAPASAPAMAPATAPTADAAPSEDMSSFVSTDSCDRPVPTQYEAFNDVSLPSPCCCLIAVV